MLPSGEMGVRVLGTEGEAGPVMQMFRDGSAEITITDAKSQRGPVMFRGTDGTSVVGIRGEKGLLSPRLYQGAKLESLIALSGIANSQIKLYADPNTPAFLVVTGADGKPVHRAPADAALPAETKNDRPKGK
jgi:hypothetical protein